ncbi:4'-phosphopantetheinyl transferase family protein [Pedobacter africanus]|uniref:4'-phosphopantetheinyl transferase superfamily protein n=1 Tax=Pedobacter africanus TaxID=151894 RepID=A0A1W2D9Q0_9SPHI|nr:4'-phosphopantetheinyl transferase superfamily protein [Pedobacter africanus]SMC93866.1 4'-phosphopantetheinyl transferase superfamily protein [Pedobacter africanus]
MIGNDIVDLDRARKESNWQRKGYLEKIFTTDEALLISTAADPELMVWLLWTMKESAYKVHSRETKIRTFTPASIACCNLVLLSETATGKVSYDDRTYFTASSIHENYIHTIAAQHKTAIKKASVRIKPYDPSNIDYKNTNPACVSHHGNYLALIYP